MNHDLLKAVIYDQHRIIRECSLTAREYHFDPNANYVLTGLRRAGKSSMLYKRVLELIGEGAEWNQIIYINFEDERLAEFSAADFNDILAVQSEMSAGKGYFFLDEIQIVAGWEKFARRLADAKERVYITGSNAKMLSREIESVLGGRYLDMYIWPYSFAEYLDARGIDRCESSMLETKARGRISAACREYLYDGGFPESLIYQSRREYVSSIYQKILLGDIAARYNIRNENGLRILIKKTAETVMNEVSFSKLHGTLKGAGFSISKDSVIDYLRYAQDAYLIFTVSNYFASFAERESTPKYYFSDNGLLNLFLVNKDGAMLENLTAVTLRRRYKDRFYFLKSEKTGIDIDFFIPENGKAIQVCDSLSDTSAEREIGNLIKLQKSMDGIRELLIVTRDAEKEILQEGCNIRAVSVERFLMEEA